MAIDNLETERKIVNASQVVDIQFAHLRPWLEYRKVTADKWLDATSSNEDIRKELEKLLETINREIVKLMGL